MIIVRLQGGLGNQMFQYAAARSLSPKQPIVLDLSFLETNTTSTASFTSRTLRLNIFKNISISKASPWLCFIIQGRDFHHRLLKKILLHGLITANDYNIGIIDGMHTIYLDGYFQNERHFSHIRPMLLKEFCFSDPPGSTVLEKIKACKIPVAVHVRRTDYLKPHMIAYHGILPLSYYIDAIRLIEKTTSDTHYFIFSDDMQWCRENFAFLEEKVTFSDQGQEDWEDMALMSICKHQIIANSSFSWWAAWLNTDEDKIVIAPKKWFVDDEAMKRAGNIVPDKWITV